MSRLIWSIWTVNAVLQWCLLGTILWRHAWRQYPAFASYIAFSCGKTSVLMWIARAHKLLYLKINISLRVVGTLLVLAIIVEIFRAVFRPYSTLPPDTLRWLRFGFLFLVAVSTAAALALPSSAPSTSMKVALVANRSVSILFCGAFALMAITSRYLGLPWTQRAYGIGAGFLIYVCVDLVVALVMAAPSGLPWTNALSAIDMTSYGTALLVWLVYFAQTEPEEHVLSLDDMQRVQDALDFSGGKG